MGVCGGLHERDDDQAGNAGFGLTRAQMGTLFSQPSQQRGRLASTATKPPALPHAHLDFGAWVTYTDANMHFQTLFALVAVFAGVAQAAAG